MIFIFDLDDTLIDNIKLKIALAKIFRFSYSEFTASRKKYFAKDNDLYSPFEHVKMLYKEGEISARQKENYLIGINKLTKKINIFLFPESIRLLKNLRKRNENLILLTHGNVKWQKCKLENLSIKRFFNKIIVANKDKTKVLKFFKKKDEIVFINDNAKENLAIKRLLPKAEVILIDGPRIDNALHKEKIFKLKEIVKKI